MKEKAFEEYVAAIVDYLEYLWIRDHALGYILDRHPDLQGWADDFCEAEANKQHARSNFAQVRAFLTSVVQTKVAKDSEALKELLKAFPMPEKPN